MNRSADFLYEKSRKIPLRCYWCSNITPAKKWKCHAPPPFSAADRNTGQADVPAEPVHFPAGQQPPASEMDGASIAKTGSGKKSARSAGGMKTHRSAPAAGKAGRVHEPEFPFSFRRFSGLSLIRYSGEIEPSSEQGAPQRVFLVLKENAPASKDIRGVFRDQSESKSDSFSQPRPSAEELLLPFPLQGRLNSMQSITLWEEAAGWKFRRPRPKAGEMHGRPRHGADGAPHRSWDNSARWRRG